MRRTLLLLTLWATLQLSAQPLERQADSTTTAPLICAPLWDAATDAAAPRKVVRRTQMIGAGVNQLFDAYLSPLDYVGPSLWLARQSERAWSARRRRWSEMRWESLQATYAENPKGNGYFWDAEAEMAYGMHHNWRVGATSAAAQAEAWWRFAVGGLLAAHLGGTYSSRNGNNPAQARLGIDASLSALAECHFLFWNRQWQWRTQLDVPIVGLQFSPHFGQSYYEIFELGHTHHNLCATYPINAPSLRCLTSLSFPWAHQRFSVGVLANFRQSQLHQLDRHAWYFAFVLGYSRTLKFLD